MHVVLVHLVTGEDAKVGIISNYYFIALLGHSSSMVPIMLVSREVLAIHWGPVWVFEDSYDGPSLWMPK